MRLNHLTVQSFNRNNKPVYYIVIPSPIAEAFKYGKGAKVKWEVKDKSLILSRCELCE